MSRHILKSREIGITSPITLWGQIKNQNYICNYQ